MYEFNRRAVVLALPFLFLTLRADDQKPPSVDEIVARGVDARGGIARVRGLQTVRMTGTALLNDQIQAAVRILSKRPNLSRFEMDVNGMTLVQAFDGKSAWALNPFVTGAKPAPAPEKQSQELRAHTDMDGLLVDYKEKGRAVVLEGTEDVSGSPAWKLKITEKDGGTDYVFIDTKSNLMVKSASTHVGVTILFSDYRAVDGLVVPFKIEQDAGPGTVKMTLDKIELNVPVDDGLFHMPVEAPAVK